MTSITQSDIETSETPVQLVKIVANGPLATPLTPADAHAPGDEIRISLYQPTSGTKFDPRCRHSLLLSSAETSRNPFFHQACVYVPDHEELYVTSNLLQPASASAMPIILISRVRLHRADPVAGDVAAAEWQKLRPPASLAMPAGATNYHDGIVYCAQGGPAEGTGGLYYMPRGKPPVPLLTGFYGKDFNSPCDVVLAGDGALWFTDPCHGFDKDFRRRPVMPCYVYRFHAQTGDLRVVAGGLARPTGMAFNPDESTVYITDTGACRGSGDQDTTRPAAIYAFDVAMRADSPFLANKRIFAVPLRGVPTGIKCDANAYVYAGCADGVEVWNPGGTLQAVIEVPGGVTGFCFGRGNEMFVCAEQRLLRLIFGSHGRAARALLQVDTPGWLQWNERTALVTPMNPAKPAHSNPTPHPEPLYEVAGGMEM